MKSSKQTDSEKTYGKADHLYKLKVGLFEKTTLVQCDRLPYENLNSAILSTLALYRGVSYSGTGISEMMQSIVRDFQPHDKKQLISAIMDMRNALLNDGGNPKGDMIRLLNLIIEKTTLTPEEIRAVKVAAPTGFFEGLMDCFKPKIKKLQEDKIDVGDPILYREKQAAAVLGREACKLEVLNQSVKNKLIPILKENTEKLVHAGERLESSGNDDYVQLVSKPQEKTKQLKK